jgi:hypothetical protein
MEENFLVTGGAGFIGSNFILQQSGIRPHLSLTWTSGHTLAICTIWRALQAILAMNSFRVDTGTHESLMDAAMYIQAIEKRQGLMVACPDEIAYRSGYITSEQVERAGSSMRNSSYGAYLLQLLREKTY